MKISFSQKGDFSKVTRWFERVREAINMGILDKYGDMGVAALSAATPVDTGLTSLCWYYEIVHENGRATLNFCNSNVNEYVQIAIILQYGHGTGTGGWVEGRDYINPAIQPVFDLIASEAWREVTKL